MKPLTKSGGLVDFKENLIFETYKNRSLQNAGKFKKEIEKKYGLKPSFNLYKKIINYQIKTYGYSLEKDSGIGYNKWFAHKHPKLRKYHNELLIKNRKQQAYLEKLEKRAKRNNVYSIEKDSILNCYIVWEVYKNCKAEVFRARLKRDCTKWLEKSVK